jgi:hypothetical protein
VRLLGVGFRFRAAGFGVLHCQRCGGDRVYRQCTGRRWLHVLFVPLVPLSPAPEHVQCTTCGTRYRLEVLRMPTMDEMERAMTAGALAAAVAMLRADGPPDSLTLAHAAEFVTAAGASQGADALREALSEPAFDVVAPLRRFARQLVTPAEEWFLADVVRIGLADGPLSDAERDAACLVAAHIGLTAAQARGVIRLTGESAAAGLPWPGPGS